MLKYLSIRTVFIYIFLLSVFLFFAHSYYTQTAIYADGKFYYSTARSIVKDFDIDFENEYRELEIGVDRTRTGYVWNMYPPGTSLFWIPGFVLVDGAVTLINFVTNVNLSNRGYSLLYQTSTAFSSITLGVLGLFIIYQLLKNYYSKVTSLLSVFSLFVTTNLLFYISVEQINSHAVSFFTASFFVYYFFQHKEDKYYYLILGILGGLAGLVRTQDAAILILPLMQYFSLHKKPTYYIENTIYLILGFTVGFLPQLYYWYKIFGVIGSPYSAFGFNFLSPRVIHVLFNSTNGLITITPAVIIAIAGLISILRSNLKKRLTTIAKYGLVYFILQLYLISSWSFYFQGGSYSIRMMITTYPLLAFGFAFILDYARNYLDLNKIFSMIVVVGMINSLLIIRYLLLY